jgi:GT2 family glycosyltransferase
MASDTAIAALPRLLGALRPGGVLVMACRPSAPSDPGPDPVSAALAEAFPHLATFRQRPLVGTLMADARFDCSRVVALADAPVHDVEVILHLGSAVPLPDLAGGVFEAPANRPEALAMAPEAPATVAAFPPALAPLARKAASAGRSDRLQEMTAIDLRRHAVSLVERLLEVDQRTADMNAEIGLERSGLEPFDHRVDDDAVLEGRAGRAFLSRFDLTGDKPDFAAAVAELNAAPMTLTLADALPNGSPDVSIIIPVFGQLAYTLNCLDSLFRHRARASAEIIVIDDVSPDCSGDLLPSITGIRYLRQTVNGGFIASCNAGAAMADGRIVVMLNNDTRVVAGWLDALVESFTLFPRAGLVGSKLLYPDGRLQEAGGIVWRDGSAWNYGRDDDPNRPHYSHARQVDYVSGASIAVPVALWRDLGGFDRHFAPAYYEDTDLCFRIRAHGLETWFQPQSRVIHYEGMTGGTDTSEGVKANQVVNGKRFFLRWRDTLATHRPNAQASYFERERGVRRRMLVVDATAPTPNQDAGSVQLMQSLRIAQELGYKVHFAPEDNFLFRPGYVTDLQRTGIECAYVPYDVGFGAFIRHYGRLFDVVVGYRVNVVERIHDLVRAYAPAAPLIYNVSDLHYLRMRREAELDPHPFPGGGADAAGRGAGGASEGVADDVRVLRHRGGVRGPTRHLLSRRLPPSAEPRCRPSFRQSHSANIASRGAGHPLHRRRRQSPTGTVRPCRRGHRRHRHGRGPARRVRPRPRFRLSASRRRRRQGQDRLGDGLRHSGGYHLDRRRGRRLHRRRAPAGRRRARCVCPRDLAGLPRSGALEPPVGAVTGLPARSYVTGDGKARLCRCDRGGVRPQARSRSRPSRLAGFAATGALNSVRHGCRGGIEIAPGDRAIRTTHDPKAKRRYAVLIISSIAEMTCCWAASSSL